MRPGGTEDAVDFFEAEAMRAKNVCSEIARLNAEAVALIKRARKDEDPEKRDLRYERAAELLQQAEELNDSHPVTCTNEGALFCDVSCLEDESNLEKWAARWAHNVLARAIHSGSADANTFRNMAFALFKLGKDDAAHKFLTESRRMQADPHTLPAISKKALGQPKPSDSGRQRPDKACRTSQQLKAVDCRTSQKLKAIGHRTTQKLPAVPATAEEKPAFAVGAPPGANASRTPAPRQFPSRRAILPKPSALDPNEICFPTRATPVPIAELEVIAWLARFTEEAKPVVAFVDRLILAAQRLHATALTIEATDAGFRVGLSWSGGETPEWKFPKEWQFGAEHYRGIVSRLMICAGQDVTQWDVPQEGECTLNTALGGVTVRVSTDPSPEGERVVLEFA